MYWPARPASWPAGSPSIQGGVRHTLRPARKGACCVGVVVFEVKAKNYNHGLFSWPFRRKLRGKGVGSSKKSPSPPRSSSSSPSTMNLPARLIAGRGLSVNGPTACSTNPTPSSLKEEGVGVTGVCDCDTTPKLCKEGEIMGAEATWDANCPSGEFTCEGGDAYLC